MKEHPDKHIREAIRYAVFHGWVFIPAGRSAHCFGRLRCGIAGHQEHMMSVWSTPGNTQNHARQITRLVDRCRP
ncbi:hypothetical protein [Yokenella regensburgei]|uniref:hypothetical protein n=1 Tax=Yokenella regensburgei TaxID=158877 RepID=UPI0004E3D250|nr:hypothetical protein [Yokenella regensburgei]KAF1368112.1 hypothetical protein FHR25_003427 [Yokenella regensburgei]KFD22074.1 hypothetical protein GYRE_02961 [Yokenella regensburgei ATCC 49455]MDQ4428758.1 hypothetical protein [Yokenella regensburgei]